MKVNYIVIKIIIIMTLFSFKINSKDCCEKQFLEACESNQLQKIKEYLDKGVSVNCLNGDNRTGLILAAMKNHAPACIYLISQRANINSKDKYGWTARMYADYYNHKNISRLFYK